MSAGGAGINITSSTLNSITIVALSNHLPSSVVSGAVFYYQGESITVILIVEPRVLTGNNYWLCAYITINNYVTTENACVTM